MVLYVAISALLFGSVPGFICRLYFLVTQQTKGKMKTAVLALAVLVTGATTWAQTIIENQRPPGNRITLPNGAVRAVTHVTLGRGKWLLSGGATLQVTVDPEVNGYYIYTSAAFTKNPNVLPVDGRVGLDSRPYNTGWIPANPKPHAIVVDNNNEETVYLVVMYYGQVPAELVQAFGSITAVKDIP